MAFLTIDHLLLIAFSVSSLIIGVHAGRHVKTLRQYAIGDKTFSTATLTYSIVASWITGGFFFNALQHIYTSGIRYMLVFMGGSLAMLLYGRILALRMGEFLNNLSVAEAMRDLYGERIQIITAITGTLNEIGFLAVQFQAITKILSIIFGIEGTVVAILVASLIIFYSAFGGVRSVTITDILQLVIFCTILPMVGLIIWRSIKNPGQVVMHTLTTHPSFSISKAISWDLNFFSALGLMSVYMIPNMTPAIFRHIGMARDLNQIKNAFTYAAAARTLILLLITWIAILLLSYHPHLDPSKLVNYLMTEYAYPGLRGLMAVALIAKAMSAADANLNASSILFINDIIKPLKPSFKESLVTIRIVSLLIGVFALILSIRIKSLLQLALWGGSMYVPVVTVPLLLATFGFRTSRRSILVGMSAGFITVLVWKYLLPYKAIPSLTPGMVANFIFLMGSHYLLREKGGWVGIKDPSPLLAVRQARRDRWDAFVRAIKQPKLYNYLLKNLPSQEGMYVLFALYVLGATYISFFTLSDAVITQYQKLYNHITYSVLAATAIFLSYPTWPITLKGKRFITFAWPLGIGYIFFIVGTILIIINGFHQVQVMLFILDLVVAALLIDWPLMLGLLLGGVLFTIGAFYMYQGSFPLAEVSNLLQFRAIYGIPLFISLLLAIIKNRQAKKILVAQNSYLLNNKKLAEEED